MASAWTWSTRSSCSRRWAGSRSPGPYFSSAIEATIAARRLGAFDLLEGLADGSKRGTIALDELGHGDPVDRIRTRARRKGADWVLTG